MLCLRSRLARTSFLRHHHGIWCGFVTAKTTIAQLEPWGRRAVYLVAPFFFLLAWKYARQFILTISLILVLVSLQFADVMAGKNASLNFFLPFSRFWELLVGAALAFVEVRYGKNKSRLAAQLFPIIGLFLIFHSAFFFDGSTPHPSFHTIIPVLGTALIITFCSKDDLVGKVLSVKPVVGIGLISYSLYLWHFPILHLRVLAQACRQMLRRCSGLRWLLYSRWCLTF